MYVGAALPIVPGLAIVPGAMLLIAPGEGDAQFCVLVLSSLIVLLVVAIGDELGQVVAVDVGAAGFASTAAKEAVTAKAPSTTKLANLLFIHWILPALGAYPVPEAVKRDGPPLARWAVKRASVKKSRTKLRR